MPRFLAVGDIHLDAGPDLGRAPGDRLREQSQVWERALEIAIDEDCDGILFAGDAFHKARPSPEAMLAFERPLVRFIGNPRGGQVIAIPGNHDVPGVSLGTGLDVFAEAGLLTLASEPAIHELAGVSVCCLPWVSASRLVAAHGGGDRDDVNAQAAELLVNVARGLREQVAGPAILLTHFSISGSSLPNGLPVEQLREPVLELSALEALGFDAIVAGHIHAPQIFATQGEPVFYVGSPIPLNFGEAGTEHGVYLLDVDVDGPHESRFIPIESRPLVTLDLETKDGGTWPPVLPETVRDAVLKIRIQATQEDARRLDVAALKREAIELGAHKVWAVQLEIEKPERARVEGLDEELDEFAALELWMESVGVNGAQADALRERTAAYLGIVRA